MKVGELISEELLFFYADNHKKSDSELNIFYTDFDAVAENYDLNKYKMITCPVYIIQADHSFGDKVALVDSESRVDISELIPKKEIG